MDKPSRLFRRDDYFIRMRRYSGFFGTELEILLKGLKAETLILVGGMTDVCVQYTFEDGRQHEYHCRGLADCVGGTLPAAHEAALAAMEYLQAGPRRRGRGGGDAGGARRRVNARGRLQRRLNLSGNFASPDVNRRLLLRE